MKRKYQTRLMSILSIFLAFVFMFVYVSPVLTSNREANAAVVVAIPMTSITVTGALNATTVILGATLQMSAAVLPANATNKVVNWSVVNATGIATISATGLLTGTQLGTVTVVARDPNSNIKGLKTITVTTVPPVVVPKTSITVTGAGNATTVTLSATLQMSAAVLPVNATNKAVNWSVVNATGIATISATGLLTGTQLGTVTVVARDPNSNIKGLKTITVTTVPPVFVPKTSITVTGAANATTVVLSATLQMSAAVLPANATSKVVNWSVVNATGLATISATGLLTGTKVGTTTVVARDPNSNIKGLKTITVTPALPLDTIAPTFQLIGSNPASVSKTLVQGAPYSDPGAKVDDNIDGAMGIITSATVVDTSVVGSTLITYTATDKAGNIGTTTRTVNVVDKMVPNSIAKFATSLLIPWAMPKSIDPDPDGADYYEIAMRQQLQQLLPAGSPMTTVWAYGSTSNDPNAVFNAPSLTIEAETNKPTRIKWINELKDANGNYLPHLLPIDQTITSWPNIQNGGMMPAPTTPLDPTSYVGPVPIITHVHGSHVVQESDGYPEAWYLPAAGGIQAGYAKTGPSYAPYKATAESGSKWVAGNAVFDYANDQRANTIWYHDHAMGFTRTNVYAGPAGFYLIRDPIAVTAAKAGDAAVLPGPAPLTYAEYAASITTGNVYEIPIALQDRTFNTDGSLFYPGSRIDFDGFAGPYIPTVGSDVNPIWNPEFFGDTILVNGNTWPKLTVQQKRYRIRFLNGSQARTFVLGLKDMKIPATLNLSFWQIGSDGGFLSQPANMNTLTMMPGERADVIIDFASAIPGDSILLSNVGPDGPFQGGVPGDGVTPGTYVPADPLTTGQVMQFNVIAADSVDPSTLPGNLVFKQIAPLVRTATAPVRGLSLNEITSTILDPTTGASIGPIKALLGTVSTDAAGKITNNPLNFADTLTESIKLNNTEEWDIYNFTVDAHPIHLHLVAFQVINRQEFDPVAGQLVGTAIAPSAGETGLKDTVMALPGQVTRIRAKFDKVGLYVWHCHILEHEENEMMRPFEVK